MDFFFFCQVASFPFFRTLTFFKQKNWKLIDLRKFWFFFKKQGMVFSALKRQTKIIMGSSYSALSTNDDTEMLALAVKEQP